MPHAAPYKKDKGKKRAETDYFGPGYIRTNTFTAPMSKADAQELCEGASGWDGYYNDGDDHMYE